MKIKKIIAGLLVATTAFSLAACGNSGSGDTKKSDADTSEKKEIVYGKSQGPYTELFEDAIVPILEKEGYTLKAVDLSDLQTADVALNDGDVDVNVEQHTAYMDSFNQSYNADLVAISPIPTVPAGVYSEKYDSVDEIPDGAKVAVPNDASNTARCYLMLQKIGWIKLDENADPSTVTQDDIVENPHNIEFTEMNSMTIPAAESDFDYIAITGSVVYNAGIDASTALANEDISDYLVLQVVVKEENKDADWAKAIVDAYHSDEFKQYMKENNDGYGGPGGASIIKKGSDENGSDRKINPRSNRSDRDEIIEFARDIYDHGELGYKEFNTAEKFIKKMKELGLRTETGLAITGTKAYLNEEKKDTASLALLGELDALRIPEHAHANPETDAAHCCGHHAQMAGIFGAALALTVPEIAGKTGWTGSIFCNTGGRVW